MYVSVQLYVHVCTCICTIITIILMFNHDLNCPVLTLAVNDFILAMYQKFVEGGRGMRGLVH